MKPSVPQRVLAIGAAAVVLAVASPATAQVSPVGTWDCIVSGYPGVGLAYLTFADNFTVSGYQLLTVVPAVPTAVVTNVAARNAGGDVGRNTVTNYGRFAITSTSGTTTVAYASCTMRLGLSQLTGAWSYDVSSGKVIGYLQQIVASATNSLGTTTNMIGSFTAAVIPNSRLWLVAATPCGRAIYNGVPAAATLPDLTGSWFAYKYQSGQTVHETFDVAPGSQGFLFTVTNGVANDYAFSGDIMVSSWNRACFSITSGLPGGTNGAVRYTGGSFNPLKFSAMTVGQEGGLRVTYNAAKVPVPGP